MKLILPEYYKKFKCIAEKCSDNCCVGWEIYIDDKTAETYKAAKGEFGEKLRRNIDFDEQCFKIDDRRRCSFLNENNLCDIIISLGEDKLCEICDRHPRYFEWLDDRIEGGIGLCCEEAARLILGADNFETYETAAPRSLCCGDEDEERSDELFYEFMKQAREKIIFLLADREIPLAESLGLLCRYAEILQDRADEYEIFDVPDIENDGCYFDTEKAIKLMIEAEPAEIGQREYFQELSEFSDIDDLAAENDKELRNIAVYFIRRYFMKAVFSGNIYPKVMLAVVGVRVINHMFNYEKIRSGSIDFEKKCSLAKMFSKIVEYSEENMQLILDNYEY